MTEPDLSSGASSSRAVDFKKALNPSQYRAATAIDGAQLVIAGAGSGKTRTLVYRVAYLVDKGIPPESILLLTFTRRAAQEMLRRAAGILDERCRRVAGGTYHSFANQTLRRHAKALGYNNNFTIIDRADGIDLMGILRTEGGYERQGKRFPRSDTLINILSKHINTGKSVEDVLAEGFPQFNDDLRAILELQDRYQSRKLEQNVMDYDDLLVNLRRLLSDNPKVRKQLSATYRHIMVDEYQDTNRLQAHIAALLASGHGRIMVVGDDAQSIYSFRGASFRNIIDFPKIFSDASTMVLEQNYRSTQPILNLANAILENAREKYTKKLFTEIPGTHRPVFLRTTDDNSQASFICEKILQQREEGIPLSEIAVLSRAAWHSNVLELELSNRNIPFRKFGGIKFVEAAHVKDVHALLKLSLNPLDAGAWFRILQLFPGIGTKTAQRLSQDILNGKGDLIPLIDPKFDKRSYTPFLRDLHQVLEKLRKSETAVADRLDAAITEYQRWMPKKYDDIPRRVQDLDALRVVAARYEKMEAFLSDLTIDPPEFTRSQPTDDPEDEWVTLSTIHSAKGLEWHTVFVLHMNAGRFPTFNTVTGSDDYEEERRLLYVAVTRAKQQLYLLKPEEIASRGGYYEIGELSPLIAEIDAFSNLVDEQTFTPHAMDDEALDMQGEDNLERLKRIEDYFA